MKHAARSILAIVVLAILCAAALVFAHVAGAQEATPDPGPVDARCCYAHPDDIPRYASGGIKRSARAVDLFRLMTPCPQWPCVDWHVDHVVPLSVGGCDAPHNMQWLPVSIKACALVEGGPACKDRWERAVYARTCFR